MLSRHWMNVKPKLTHKMVFRNECNALEWAFLAQIDWRNSNAYTQSEDIRSRLRFYAWIFFVFVQLNLVTQYAFAAHLLNTIISTKSHRWPTVNEPDREGFGQKEKKTTAIQKRHTQSSLIIIPVNANIKTWLFREHIRYKVFRSLFWFLNIHASVFDVSHSPHKWR